MSAFEFPKFSRRHLLTGALVGGATIGLAACGYDSEEPQTSDPAAPGSTAPSGSASASASAGDGSELDSTALPIVISNAPMKSHGQPCFFQTITPAISSTAATIKTISGGPDAGSALA